MRTLVLDAWPMTGYLRGEACRPAVIGWLEKAAAEEVALAMTTVNWGEVVYTAAKREDVAIDRIVSGLGQLPVELVPVDRHLTVLAARLKAERGFGYADAFAAALAMTLDAPLVTGDPDFRALLPELALEWVGA